MKLSITFDADDFSGMLVDFFKEAGYVVEPKAMQGAKVAFNGIFPDGLTLTVNPLDEVPVAPLLRQMPMVSVEEAPPVAYIEAAVPATEPTLPLSRLMDPEYAEVAQLTSILNLSKTLEKSAK